MVEEPSEHRLQFNNRSVEILLSVINDHVSGPLMLL